MYSSLFALAASISGVAAVAQGFNYGAVTRTGAAKFQADFEAEFSAAKGLANTNGAFSSARLYTTIQAGTTNTPIEAIPAAISSKTKLMLGMWASGTDNIDNEIKALTNAIEKYGDDFTDLVNGISVGSEDLYRITPTGLANDPLSVGQGPAVLAKFIKQVKEAIKGTSLSSAPVGHVDTWTAWQNGSNAAVIAECDFLGMNTFPYFQTTESNGIDNGASLFQAALDVTKNAAGGKPVIITETGWPVGGKTSAKAEASTKNAKTYWDEVGCSLFGNTDVYWYTLVDANTDITSQPQFGIVGTTLNTTPLFNLTCPAVKPSSSSSGSASQTSSSGGSAATGSGSSTITSVIASETVLTSVQTRTSTNAAGSTVVAVSTGVFTSTSFSTFATAAPTANSGASSGNSSASGTSAAGSSSTSIPGAASISTVSYAAAAMAAVAGLMAMA
ncbi:glycoside hydrolase superfamily [Bisporella sp. PMI_857]|nr:glycoside hydrolase superfamily [Bisporella sp. PMI_857]